MIPYDFNPMGKVTSPFKKLQYLQSAGSQWINTGIYFNRLTDKVEITAVPTTAKTIIIFGAQGFGIVYAGSGEFSINGLSDPISGCAINEEYSIAAGLGTLKVNTESVTYTNSAKVTTVPCALFGSKHQTTSGAEYGWVGRISRFALYRSGTLLQNLTPALCPAGKSYIDGNTGQKVTATADKPGMYDSVSKRFFVNQGGNEFSYA